MTKWIKRLLVIALITGLAGAGIFAGVYFTTGKSSVSFNELFNDSKIKGTVGLEIELDDKELDIDLEKKNNQGKNKIESVIIEETYDTISSLSIDADASQIRIISAKDNKVSIKIETNEVSTAEAVMNEGKLSIKVEQEGSHRKGQSNQVVITVPKDQKLADSIINLNASEMDAAAGEWINTEWTLNASEADFNNSTFESSVFELKASEVEIENSSLSTVTINVDAGSFDFNGTVNNDINVTCNAGSADFELKQTIDTVSLSAQSSAGEISVNDNRVKNGYSDEKINASARMNLSVSMGEIEVDFKRN